MIHRPLRIAILMPTFYEQMVGGAEYQTYLLAEAAKQQGCDVHYVFVSRTNGYANRLRLELHPIRPHPFSKRLGATWSLYGRIGAAFAQYGFRRNIPGDHDAGV